MLNAKTGISTKADVKLAGKEAAQAVKEVKDMKMAFVYSGVQYDQKALLAAISEELPGVPLVGNTSFTGIITQDGFVTGDDGFVGIMAMGGEELTVGVAGMPKAGTARETGHKVAEAALKKAGKAEAPDYFYMVAPPGEEEFYLKGITEVIGRVPFFGGSAADNAIAGEWLLYTDEMVTADGVAVAFFYGDTGFANEYTGAYEETEHAGIITKVDNYRTLAEIDGVPALKKYQEWTGASDVAIRHPMNGNEDKTIAVGNNLAENTAIILMKGSVDGLIASTGKAVAKVTDKLGKAPAAYHLVHCGGRRAGIDARIDEVAAELKKAAGDVPFICEFTFGEYGFEDDGRNTCGGLMLSFTAFGK